MIKRKLKRLPVIETYNGAKLHFDSGIYVSRDGKYLVKDGHSRYEGNKDVEVELFTWEKLDYVDKVKAAFGL